MSMKTAGFYKATAEPISSLFVSISGHDNSGKTHFSLTGPGDIAFFNLDKGLKGVLQKFAKVKDIWLTKVDIPKPQTEMVTIEKDGKKINKNIQVVTDDVTSQATKSLNQVISKARLAMVEDSIRTIVFDTGGALWELWRVARFGKILQVPASAYPPVNAEFVGFCDELKDSGKNVIFTHKMRPVYVNDKKTDRYEPAAFGTMDYITDVSLLTEYDSDEDEFSLVFTRCKAKPELQYDYELPSDVLCDFPSMAALVVDDTEEEDWR